jgi:hypothetical protein
MLTRSDAMGLSSWSGLTIVHQCNEMKQQRNMIYAPKPERKNTILIKGRKIPSLFLSK